ncbi:MAG: RNA polymerase sigma factor [Candidatus Paceibacterota bacterium]
MNTDDPQHAKEAFLQVYDEYADAIFKHCFFRVSDRELAKDLAHDTFARTWRSVAQGNEIKNMKAFLYRVAHNLIVDSYGRKEKRTTSLDEMREGDEEGESAGFEPEDADAVERIEGNADRDRVRAAVAKLEEKYRTAVTMRYLDELSPKEIARITGESENVISVRVNRGLGQLRTLLDINQE